MRAYHGRILEDFDKGDQQKKGRRDINLATGKFFTAFSFLFHLVTTFLAAIYVVQARTTITGPNDGFASFGPLMCVLFLFLLLFVAFLLLTTFVNRFSNNGTPSPYHCHITLNPHHPKTHTGARTTVVFGPNKYFFILVSPDTPTYHLLFEMEDGMLSISNKR